MPINISSQPVLTTPFSECYNPKLSFERRAEKARATHLEVEKAKAKDKMAKDKTIHEERAVVVRELMARRKNLWNAEESLAIRLAVLKINALLSVDLDEDVWDAMIASEDGHQLIVRSMSARFGYWVANWWVIAHAKSIKARWQNQEYQRVHDLEDTKPGDPFISTPREHNEQILPTSYSPPARLEIIKREAPRMLKRRCSEF